MNRLNALEAAVLDKLLEGNHPALDALRVQSKQLDVTERRLTGVGFFTELRVLKNAPRATTKSSVRFGDVVAEIAGLQHGAGFVLYLDDGMLTALEGYSFDEPWPASIDNFSVRFVKAERDFRPLEQ